MSGADAAERRAEAARWIAIADQDIAAAFQDEHPRMREHALRLAACRIHRSESLRDAVVKLAELQHQGYVYLRP